MSPDSSYEHELPLLNSPTFIKARKNAEDRRRELHELLTSKVSEPYAYTSEASSLAVFGSLARDEWTSGSDLDWTYLVDGQVSSPHLDIALKIKRVLKDSGRFPSPGQTGIFGNLAFSHEIVHQIGGQADTNRNTTQRVLLLLESRPIGPAVGAHERVISAIIDRYLEEHAHLLAPEGDKYRVPRFLLNDIVRFWRTMAVDFASKQRDRGGEGWGLRNAKLRMSRKLIFASGLLLCFSCNLDPKLSDTIPKGQISTDENVIKQNLVKHIQELVRQSPLELVAQSLIKYSVPDALQKDLFGAYAEFLELLDDEKSRNDLKKLRAEDAHSDTTFNKVKEISSTFQRSLDRIFFEHEDLGRLTRKYGVF